MSGPYQQFDQCTKVCCANIELNTINIISYKHVSTVPMFEVRRLTGSRLCLLLVIHQDLPLPHYRQLLEETLALIQRRLETSPA